MPSFNLDHVSARRAGGSDDPANLQWTCHRCHSAKTARSDGGFGNEPRPGLSYRIGADGRPIGEHPWAKR